MTHSRLGDNVPVTDQDVRRVAALPDALTRRTAADYLARAATSAASRAVKLGSGREQAYTAVAGAARQVADDAYAQLQAEAGAYAKAVVEGGNPAKAAIRSARPLHSSKIAGVGMLERLVDLDPGRPQAFGLVGLTREVTHRLDRLAVYRTLACYAVHQARGVSWPRAGEAVGLTARQSDVLRRHPVEVPGVLADPAVISALLAEIDTLAAAAEQLVPARDAAVEAAAHAEITDTFGYDVPARIHALAADPSVERRAHDATELSRELQQHLMVEKRIRKHAGYALHERDGVPWRVVQELAGVWHNAIVWARTRMPADALRGLREDAEALVRLSRVKIELYQAWDQHVREQVRDPAVQELAEVHNPATVSAISGIRSNHLSAILHPKPRRKVA